MITILHKNIKETNQFNYFNQSKIRCYGNKHFKIKNKN